MTLQVPNPLRLTSRSNQVSDTTDAEQFDGRATWDAGLATAHFEDARAPHTDTDLGGGGDDAVEDIAREPAWSSIAHVGTHAGHVTPLPRVAARGKTRTPSRWRLRPPPPQAFRLARRLPRTTRRRGFNLEALRARCSSNLRHSARHTQAGAAANVRKEHKYRRLTDPKTCRLGHCQKVVSGI